MNGEYQYFVCGSSESWKKGLVDNVEVFEQGIRLKSSTEFIFKDKRCVEVGLRLLFSGNTENSIYQAAPLDSNNIYLIDFNNCVWHWQDRSSQLKKIYQPSEVLESYSQLKVNSSYIFLLNKIENHIRMIDIASGQIVRDVTAEHYLKGRVVTIEATETAVYMLCALDGELQIWLMDIGRGDIKPYGQFYALPDYDNSDNGKVIAYYMKHHKDSAYIALSYGQVIWFLEEGGRQVKHIRKQDERMTDFLPTEEGYYITIVSKKDHRDPVTSIYRTNRSLDRQFCIKDTRGEGAWLYRDSHGLFQWFNEEWCLCHYVPGDVYGIDQTSGEKIAIGHYISRCYDTYREKESWHRYLIRFLTGINTRIKISYYTTEEDRLIFKDQKFTIEGLMASEELSFEEKKAVLCQKRYFRCESINCKDGLFQNTRGRYLWFLIELTGNTYCTPIVKHIQMTYRHPSYLRYLPEVYQQDKASSIFLDRFLSLFEGFLADMEKSIDEIHQCFIPGLTSGKALGWLSQWLGFNHDISWSDRQIRTLIEKTPEIYRKKGTKYALETMLQIYLEIKPSILEYSDIKGIAGEKELEERLYGCNPFTFFVLIKKEDLRSKIKISNVVEIIREMKPAFTEGKLIILEESIVLGDHCYVGMNTVLSGERALTLNDQTYLLNDLVMYDTLEADRLGFEARLDRDTYLR